MPNNHKQRKGKGSRKSLSPEKTVGQTVTRVADFTREFRAVDRKLITIDQWCDYGLITSTSVAAGVYAYPFVFTDLPDNASYSSAFDQYKVESLEFHLVPLSQASLPGSALAYSQAFVIHDYDDAVNPASAAAMRAYKNCVILAPGDRHARKIKPHTATAATSSAAASIIGARNEPANWIDITSTSVPHYGIKVFVTQSTSTSVTSWYLWCRATVSLRGQR